MTSLTLRVVDRSHVGEARRLAQRLAGDLGFDATGAGKVAIAVTETATNLVKHAAGGEILLRRFPGRDGAVLEMIAIDRGPGMQNVAESLGDGHSTAGTAGNGLGAIARLSSLFDIYSVPGAGTVVLARFVARTPSPPAPPRGLQVGAVSVAVRGESVCGDGWTVANHRDRPLIVVSDGLGHGADAGLASAAALESAERHPDLSPVQHLERMHEALRATRGAAVAIAEIDVGEGLVRFAGIGNIVGMIVADAGTRGMVSHHGTLGHDARKFQEFTYPWSHDALLVMHSDGLRARWTFDAYPGLARRHAGVAAAVLYRDFARPRDDATVVAARESP